MPDRDHTAGYNFVVAAHWLPDRGNASGWWDTAGSAVLAARPLVAARAGTAGDLPEADIVNPHDLEALKAALFAAGATSEAMRLLHARVIEHDAHAWTDTFLAALAEVMGPDRPDVHTEAHS